MPEERDQNQKIKIKGPKLGKGFPLRESKTPFSAQIATFGLDSPSFPGSFSRT